jgi:hypothetical protein
MAVDPFRMLGSGDVMPRSATTFNALLRAANSIREHDADRLAERIRRTPQSGVVVVRNASLEPVQRFGVLGIDRPTVLPNQDEIGFASRVHLRGVAPTSEHLGRFVILLQPLSPGEMGLGVISGVTICRVHFPQEGFKFAEVAVGQDEPIAPLTAQGYGPVQVLWAGQFGKGNVAWCIVRIGNCTRAVDFTVRVAIDGGSPGTTGVSTCSFTYTVHDLYGNLLGTGTEPAKRRLEKTPYTVTPDNAYGKGFYDADGQFILWSANETPKTKEDCP